MNHSSFPEFKAVPAGSSVRGEPNSTEYADSVQVLASKDWPAYLHRTFRGSQALDAGGVRRRDSRLDLLTHMTQLPPRLCLQQRAIPMIRTPTSWSDKTLMWLLVCLVAIATLDDFGSIAMASPSSELFIVAEDDDPDDSAERPPICAAGGVGHTDIRWFARSATEITGPAERRNGLVLRYGPRGPPADGSDQHGCKRSLLPLVPPSSIHPSSPVSVAGTPHHTSFEVQTLTSHAMMRAQTAVHDGFFGTCLNRTLAATPYHGLWRRRRRGRQ